jgi:hypothetical protein
MREYGREKSASLLILSQSGETLGTIAFVQPQIGTMSILNKIQARLTVVAHTKRQTSIQR